MTIPEIIIPAIARDFPFPLYLGACVRPTIDKIRLTVLKAPQHRKVETSDKRI